MLYSKPNHGDMMIRDLRYTTTSVFEIPSADLLINIHQIVLSLWQKDWIKRVGNQLLAIMHPIDNT